MSDKTIDDLFGLMERFCKSVDANVQVIRQHATTSGDEIYSLKQEFHRHKSDVFKAIVETNDKLDALKKQVEALSCMQNGCLAAPDEDEDAVSRRGAGGSSGGS